MWVWMPIRVWAGAVSMASRIGGGGNPAR
jgi:hypothetical protein